MKNKIYHLFYLDANLRKSGAAKKCFKYDLSSNGSMLHIVYHDFLLNEQFIFVFRTSRLCYRIFYDGVLCSRRTCKVATAFIEQILSEIIKNNDYYKVMTLAEFNSCSEITHAKEIELYLRGKQKK